MLKAEFIPTQEDWQYIQGGKPRIFESPTGKSFELAHVYGQSFDPTASYPQYGCVINTAGDRFRESISKPIEIEFLNTILKEPEQRIVRIPAAMLIKHHGSECADRSYKAGSRNSNSAYEKISGASLFAGYLENRITRGYQERRIGVDPLSNGYRLLPILK